MEFYKNLNGYYKDQCDYVCDSDNDDDGDWSPHCDNCDDSISFPY